VTETNVQQLDETGTYVNLTTNCIAGTSVARSKKSGVDIVEVEGRAWEMSRGRSLWGTFSGKSGLDMSTIHPSPPVATSL